MKRMGGLVLVVLGCWPQLAVAEKPKLEELLKPKSITRVVEDYEIVTNSEWTDTDDFKFVNAALIRAPMRYARPQIVKFSNYPKMSDAIKTFNYDEKNQIIEVIGEKAGLRMHSWIKVNQELTDELSFDFIRGDMKGFKVKLYLWDNNGKTLVVGKGLLPKGRKLFSTPIAIIFKPVSEIVLGVATRNFRSYIEEEYKKQK